jgi:hypothetical protein
MASRPTSTQLPLFYNDLIPVNSEAHKGWRMRQTDKAPWIAKSHIVPLTVEEFPLAQRNFPIVFSAGDEPIPLALMGLNEGVNVFVAEDGTVKEPIYMPAYVRRYPFMLAKLREDADELSLCFDPTTELVGDYEDGNLLFDGNVATEATQATLKFCEQFEIAGQKTAQFMKELMEHDLLMDGEVNIQTEGQEKPFTYRGFRMVSEEKLKELRGDTLRKWNQSGLLPLLFAHLFSLDHIREIFGKQVQMGRGPKPQESNGQA